MIVLNKEYKVEGRREVSGARCTEHYLPFELGGSGIHSTSKKRPEIWCSSIIISYKHKTIYASYIYMHNGT